MEKSSQRYQNQIQKGMFGYEFSQNIGWLVGETTGWVEIKNIGVLTKEEYDEL